MPVLTSLTFIGSNIGAGGGGINPLFLPRDTNSGCAPVYPHNLPRDDTIFEVVKSNRGYTALSDKHPFYDFVYDSRVVPDGPRMQPAAGRSSRWPKSWATARRSFGRNYGKCPRAVSRASTGS